MAGNFHAYDMENSTMEAGFGVLFYDYIFCIVGI